MWAIKDKLKKSISSIFVSDKAGNKSFQDSQLKDGKHSLRKYEKSLKMDNKARYEKAKDLKLCFSCLSSKHVIEECTYKPFRVDGCHKRHYRLLHRESSKQSKNDEKKDFQQKAEATSVFC